MVGPIGEAGLCWLVQREGMENNFLPREVVFIDENERPCLGEAVVKEIGTFLTRVITGFYSEMSSYCPRMRVDRCFDLP